MEQNGPTVQKCRKKGEMLKKESKNMQEENHGISLKPLRALTKKKF